MNSLMSTDITVWNFLVNSVMLLTCQRCKHTTSVDIKKKRYKKLFTHVESHASAVSLLESGE